MLRPSPFAPPRRSGECPQRGPHFGAAHNRRWPMDALLATRLASATAACHRAGQRPDRLAGDDTHDVEAVLKFGVESIDLFSVFTTNEQRNSNYYCSVLKALY